MNRCIFIKDENSNKYICKNCGTKVPSANVKANCKSNIQPITLNPPTILEKALNFGTALVKHVVAGAPRASQETIEKRLSICKECPLYQASESNNSVGICTHNHCGCNIAQENQFLNKLAWADQSCPIEKWGPDGV